MRGKDDLLKINYSRPRDVSGEKRSKVGEERVPGVTRHGAILEEVLRTLHVGTPMHAEDA
ncbi:hypothetical protein DD237_007527 [Peronospora effusa]|uniref:Uncharacterized protein n=1 Tax=Peronospora effusa TaxID=542832 RepID=A0A3R7Y0V8_9STRA|nr:hypothetical protein DD237_007527 [Peronospora effusa]